MIAKAFYLILTGAAIMFTNEPLQVTSPPAIEVQSTRVSTEKGELFFHTNFAVLDGDTIQAKIKNDTIWITK